MRPLKYIIIGYILSVMTLKKIYQTITFYIYVCNFLLQK